MNTQLILEGVSKSYGGLHAAADISLIAPVGRITSIVGPNGAGKSTLFSLIGGQQRADTGKIMWSDHDVTRMSPEARAGLGIARTFQTTRLIPGFRVLENVMVGAFRHERTSFVEDVVGGPRRRREHARIREDAESCLDRVGLLSLASDRADSLSYGQRRLVELARALATQPNLLLLDEPAAGLHTDEADRLGELLTRLAGDGVGVLLVEHNMGLVMRISHHVAVLNFGRLIAEGPPEDVAANDQVLDVYLGRGSLSGR